LHSRGLRGGGDPPYDARLCTHSDGYCVSRHDLRMKSLAAASLFAGDAPARARSAAAARRWRRRRGAGRGMIAELVRSVQSRKDHKAHGVTVESRSCLLAGLVTSTRMIVWLAFVISHLAVSL